MQEFNKSVVFLPILCDIMLKNFRFVKSQTKPIYYIIMYAGRGIPRNNSSWKRHE